MISKPQVSAASERHLENVKGIFSVPHLFAAIFVQLFTFALGTCCWTKIAANR